MGQSPESSFISNNSDGMEFHQGKIHFTEKYIQKANNYTFSITKIAPKNAILLCVRAPVGVVNITEREICIGRGLCSIYPKYQIQSEFWFYWLQWQKDTFEQKATGTTFQAISIELIKNILIPLPPLSEQHRIVTAIEAIFTQIELLEQNKADLQTAVKQAKSKILDLAIHGKLVPQDPADEPASVMLERLRAEKEAKIAAGEIKRSKNDSYIYRNPTDNCYYEKIDNGTKETIKTPFIIPESWIWCRFSAVADVINGKNQSKVEDDAGEYPIYGSGGIMGHANNYICPENCTIIGRKGSINNPVFVEEKFWNVDTAFGLMPLSDILPQYLFYFCKSFDFTSLDSSTTLPSLTKTSIQQILFPLPPLSEQQRILNTINNLFTKLNEIILNLI
ncbi:restriction endonuclease subunit S [Treponema vincentii]|uniref:restriction endonuclease subunit S n=1 Tax=Treponema vincentii TaxID=69710 RepID=UPI0020A46ECC